LIFTNSNPAKNPTMASRQLTAGIIGLGYGRAHIAGLQAAGVQVLALCQRDTGAAASLAQQYQVPQVFGRWQDLLEQARPDIVVIATPPALHLPILKAAMAVGCHVVCEKPLATSSAEAQEMIAAAAAQSCLAITSFNWRFAPAMQRMKQMVDAGHLGRVFHVNARWFNPAWVDANTAPTWRMDRAQAGYGALGDLGVHLIDLVQWLFGPVEKVMACSATAHAGRTVPDRTRPADAEDFSHVVAELQTGVSVAITVSRVARGLNEHSLEVYGDQGALAMRQTRTGDGWHVGELRAASGAGMFEPVVIPTQVGNKALSTDRLDLIGQTTLCPMLQQFITAIESRQLAAPSLQDGASAQAVLDAILASSLNMSWVTVNSCAG
jgi:predicted dehydrogenase